MAWKTEQLKFADGRRRMSGRRTEGRFYAGVGPGPKNTYYYEVSYNAPTGIRRLDFGHRDSFPEAKRAADSALAKARRSPVDLSEPKRKSKKRPTKTATARNRSAAVVDRNVMGMIRAGVARGKPLTEIHFARERALQSAVQRLIRAGKVVEHHGAYYPANAAAARNRAASWSRRFMNLDIPESEI